MNPILLRRSGAASALAVSESQLLKWERAGLITPIRLPGIRAVAYDATDVAELGRRIIAEGRVETRKERG